MKKAFHTTYAALAYAAFLGVVLYMVGFVTDLVVPKTIDSPVSGLPTALAALVNVGLVALFGLQHSIMARPTFKRFVTKFVPEPIERATYVWATNIVFAVIFWLWQPIDVTIWSVGTPALQYVLYGLSFLGFGLVVYTTFLINHFDLFGLRQIWFELKGERYRPLGFQMPGIYKYVRHPLYIGWLTAFWAIPTMTLGHLIFAGAQTAYILVAIYFEERNLVEAHPEYEAYRRRTPKLVPKLKPTTAADVVSATVSRQTEAA